MVIFLILTVFVTAIFVSFNVINYRQEYNAINRSLNQTQKISFAKMPPNSNGEKPNEPNDMGDIKFMDRTVYTVILDEDDKIKAIINHSNNNISADEIEEIAVHMISQSCQKEIGNLYIAEYSYSYHPQESIVIVDNTSSREQLRSSLLLSLILYALLEGIIILAARILALRITKPVAESFDKQKQFIADASHELKTPLSVIIASADALESNPTEKKWLTNIKTESERMNKLIADLLELAKSEAVNDKSEFAYGELSKLVEKSALTFEGVLFENGVTLEEDIEPGIWLNMNYYKIQQLMSILLDNAVKHSEKGGTVNVMLRRDKGIVLAVTNEGEGIPKGEEEKIFERFYRADESRNRNENRYGLGLAIAKNICQLHDAQLTAKSENGKTTFKVVF